MQGLVKMGKRWTSYACLQEIVPFSEVNEILNVNEVVGAEVETCWYGVLVEICGVVVTLSASRVEETSFCTVVVVSAVVQQGYLVFS